VKREIIKNRLRKIISEVMLKEDHEELHRNISGETVSMCSPECVEDLQFRIDDTRQDRDICSKGTDSRTYYNGLLNVLRKKLRRSQKLQSPVKVTVIDDIG
jgi:hypothetical protein